MRRWMLPAVLALTAIASGARAQTVTGRVLDSATRAPVKGVSVSLGDATGIAATMRTTDSGLFSVRARKGGTYTLTVKRVGFTPVSIAVTLADGQTMTRVVTMTELANGLDTVVITASRKSFFAKTPGRTQYQQHLLANRGQMVSGVEIKASKMGVMDFLGSMPGFRVAGTVPSPAPGGSAANSPPTIPGKTGFLLSTSGTQCLFGRIDRFSIIGLLDLYDADVIEELVEVEDIMGIEMYASQDEIPPEWRVGITDLVWRTNRDGKSYFIGDMGFPARPRPTIRSEVSDRADSRPVPQLFWARFPAPPLHTIDSATMAIQPVLNWNRLTRLWTSINDVYPQSFALPTITPPQCGFIQIWTRKAW